MIDIHSIFNRVNSFINKVGLENECFVSLYFGKELYHTATNTTLFTQENKSLILNYLYGNSQDNIFKYLNGRRYDDFMFRLVSQNDNPYMIELLTIYKNKMLLGFPQLLLYLVGLRPDEIISDDNQIVAIRKDNLYIPVLPPGHFLTYDEKVYAIKAFKNSRN